MIPLLHGENLYRTFTGPHGRRTDVITDVSLRLEAGHTVGIVGESGSGKTTLARMLAGIDQPTSGTVRLNGRPLPRRGARRRESRRHLQLVPQHASRALNPRISIGRHLREVLDAHRIVPANAYDELIAGRLVDVGLNGDDQAKLPQHLSGGQQQRVVIARSLLLDPQVLICDEPTSALDISVQAQIIRLLWERCRGSDRALVIITHDLRVARELCDRVLVMHRGHVVEQGPTQRLLTRPEHSYTQQLVASAREFSVPGPAEPPRSAAGSASAPTAPGPR
nr:ATP-binding cassette domain-containing protein [Streptomyces sp. NBC_00886]